MGLHRGSITSNRTSIYTIVNYIGSMITGYFVTPEGDDNAFKKGNVVFPITSDSKVIPLFSVPQSDIPRNDFCCLVGLLWVHVSSPVNAHDAAQEKLASFPSWSWISCRSSATYVQGDNELVLELHGASFER